MMGSDFELVDGRNPSVESEYFLDGSSLENKVDSASVHVISSSDNSTVVQDVESVGGSVAEGSMDSVSAQGNVSDVNNRRSGDSGELVDLVSHDKELFSDRNHGSVKNVKSDQQKGQRKKESKSKESGSPVYDSMLSMFDDFAANGGGALVVRSSLEASPGHKFEVGDMVWGKVKSHPWWPGHVYSEEFATPAVRRLKRDGLLLVAFFGDSSYGWFDPSELIPFDSNFAEKSRQTNSKTFVKAVEEAIDEVSRRSALGLSCMCRSKQNFRETSVQGFYAVDVVDYEPGALYSIDLIEKARDSFQPSSALDFVRQLALEPTCSEDAGIDFIKNKANAISYRRAIYEEFDEPYAQAFGYQPAHSSPGSVQEPPGRKPSKAPLSGRQVFAETSGKGKSSAKPPNKPKDHAKKDKYLFKRRDESKVHQKEKAEMTFSPQLGHVEDSIALAASEYVLQKRVSPTQEQVGTTIAKDELASKDATGTGTRTGVGLEDTPIVLEFSDPGFQMTKSKVESRSGGDEKKIVQQMEDRKVLAQNDVPNSAIIASQRIENGPKKVKVVKRPVGEMGSGKSALPEKKKKRKKESDGTHILVKVGVPMVEKVSAKKPVQSALATKSPIEDPRGTDSKAITLSSHTAVTQEMTGPGSYEAEIQQILGDLHLLALDPFHAIKKGLAVKARQVFLRFRSVVFQKSLNSSSLAEDDVNDTHSSKSSAVITATSGPENGVKPQAGKPDDPTKGGRKRGPSDRQEEMAEKKKKKVGDIRKLTKEKKVIKRIDEPAARDVKQPVVMASRKSGSELKNTEQRTPEPTMLIMKFPTGGSLPSINELKARFARYGPMDHSATRIYWNTFTCRVVYRNKSHAQAAYKFVTGSSSVFGNADVKCSLKEFGVVGSADSEPPVKVPKEDPSVEDRPASLLPGTPGLQLKSCLKKSGGEEAGGRAVPRVKFMLGGDESHKTEKKNGSGSSFGDGGASSFSSSSHATMDFNSKNFQKAVPPLPFPSSTAVTSQFTRPPPPAPQQQNSMHYGTAVAPPSLPPLPQRSLNYGAGAGATDTTPLVHNMQRPIPATPKVDISQQMLSLLTQCNEVVTNVTNLLGYVPYHPL